MSNYKLISMKPTAEMIEAAEDAYMPFGDMDLALRMALLASPDVHGEPVAPEGFRLIAVNETFDSLTFWLDRCEQKGHLENCADLVEPWESFEYREVEAPQPAPDVSALVEALERIASMDSMSYHSLDSAKITARAALAAHRKQGSFLCTAKKLK